MAMYKTFCKICRKEMTGLSESQAQNMLFYHNLSKSHKKGKERKITESDKLSEHSSVQKHQRRLS